MMPVKRLQSFKESFSEILVIVKVCLTSFWFWLPVLHCIYFFLQIWLIFYVHPLTILLLPLILSIYLILQREKRAKAFYDLHEAKYLSASRTIGAGPETKTFKWQVAESVKEYAKLLKEETKRTERFRLSWRSESCGWFCIFFYNGSSIR